MRRELNAWPLIALSGLLFCGGCMSTLGDRPTVGMGLPSYASPYFGSFDRLWSRHTILLTQLRDGPGGGAGSSGEESAFFPVLARATYMDSAVIDAGFHTFGDLASMSEEERSGFRSAYRSARAPGDTLFIWLEMRTSSTEDFLDLGRWTIFLQDETGKQIEPSRFVEHPLQRQGGQGVEQEELRPGERERSGFSATVKKEVELYFPHPPAAPASPGAVNSRTLRLIMFETKNPLLREEGAWQISADSVSRGPR